MTIKSLRFHPASGTVRTNDAEKAAADRAPMTKPAKKPRGEIEIEAKQDGVKVATPMGTLDLQSGSFEMPGGARLELFVKDGARHLSLTSKHAQEPLLYKLGVDGFEQVKNFAAGINDVLKFVEGGLSAAVDARTNKQVAGTVVAERGQKIDQLRVLAGVTLEKAPKLSEGDWAVREKAVIKKIVSDPVAAYGEMRSRLLEKGPMAPFPEFEPVVTRLLHRLRDLGTSTAGNESLERTRQVAMTKLVHAGMQFRVDTKDYPYAPPFEAPYPYKQTLDAIKSAIEVFDVAAVVDKSQQTLPLYHTDRYQYYWDAMTLDGKTLVFPTLEPLGFEDLIRTRAAPLGFIGVATETVFVDRHRQSPLDFFVHDVNHVRRMVGYSDRDLERRGVKGHDDEMKVYGEYQSFIQEKLIPLLSLKGKTGDDNLMAHLVRLIVFELLHESAVEPTTAAMVKTLTRKEGAPDPFEHMLVPGSEAVNLDSKSIEALRNAVGNLDSGVEAAGYPDGNMTVRYFMDRAVVLLGNVYNKMAFGFFDEFDDPKAYICAPKDRTPENVARAAEVLYRALGQTPPPFAELVRQAKSTTGSEELFQAYPKTEGVPT